MFECSIGEAQETASAALSEMRAESGRATGQDLIDHLKFLNSLRRRIEHDSLQTIARLSAEGEFERRAVRPAPAVADLLGLAPAHARRLVATADSVLRTSFTGQTLEPKLPATATALGGYEIDQAHAEVIDRALSTGAARRIGPERWSAVEVKLADWARVYPSDQLAHLARELIDKLDEDGPQPAADYPQVNELHTTNLPDGGCRIKGRLDAPTAEVVRRAIRAPLSSDKDDSKSLGERQADALGAICAHALDDAYLPGEGGQRPHITAVLDYDRLVERGRGTTLEFGGYTSAAQLRRILCDSCVTPAVLGGDSVPLDLGRTRRPRRWLRPSRVR